MSRYWSIKFCIPAPEGCPATWLGFGGRQVEGDQVKVKEHPPTFFIDQDLEKVKPFREGHAWSTCLRVSGRGFAWHVSRAFPFH